MPHDQLLVSLEWDRTGRVRGVAGGAAGNLLGQIKLQDPIVKMLRDRCVYSGGLWISGAECEDHRLRGV